MVARGVVYWNVLYPGHVMMLDNSSYQIPFKGTKALVNLARHIEAVEVTDFSNDFEQISDGKKCFVFLKRPIEQKPTDTITAQFSVKGCEKEYDLIFTRSRYNAIYRKHAYTELIVGYLIHEECEFKKPKFENVKQIVNRFLSVYRAISGDVHIPLLSNSMANMPVFRTSFIKLAKAPDTFDEISFMNERIPSGFYPSIFPVEQFAYGLLRHTVDPKEMSHKVGDYLISDVPIPEPLSALLTTLEQFNLSMNANFAVIDAFSVAEVVWVRLFDETSRQSDEFAQLLKRKQRNNDMLDAKAAINSLLPQIINKYSNEHKELIGKLDRVRKKRRLAVHGRTELEYADAELAIETVRELIKVAQIILRKWELSLA